MYQHMQSGLQRILLILLCGVALTMMSAQVVLAQQEPAAQPAAVTADDGGAWEVGIHGTAGDLTTATAAERAGMWDKLNGWFVRRYSYNETWAWEEDFKRASLGGTENSYIDSVDLQFYVGHGSPARITFADTTHDDNAMVAPGDCNTTWGDGDNEWLALTSCQVLADAGVGPMAQCMNRQHLILGFVTNASAHNISTNTQAYHFGRYLRSGYSVTSAWFSACDVAQRNRVARVIAEETACFNDKPYYSSVCSDVLDNDYYWQTHNCGTESASAVPVDQVLSMPVFAFKPYSLAEAQQDFSSLGSVFNVPIPRVYLPAVQRGDANAAGVAEDPAPPPAPDTGGFLVSSDGQLELDTNSGIYRYANHDQLWSQPSVDSALAARAAGATMLTADDARAIADAFLNNNSLMPGDAVFYEVVQDTAGTIDRDVVVASAADIAAAETPMLQQVIYSRKLTAPTVTAAGVDVITYTVVGPGAKQKVYLPATLPAGVNAANLLEAVAPVGVQGGWRELEPLVDAASGEQVMATILDEATAAALYLTLDSDVTMNSLPIDVSGREILSSTLAYWEDSAGSDQAHLIPVFEFTVRMTETATNDVFEDFVYVPASTDYLRPLARVTDAPQRITAGTTMTLTAADASQTLRALGIGPFDFVMGYNGADGAYLYDWYLGAVAPENKITDLNPGDGLRTISFVAPAPADDREASIAVLLVVTDNDSPNGSKSTTVANIAVVQP